MDYVCKVIGDLSIEENSFKLKVSFNEVIDLSPNDFKVSPRLRAALRNHEIEVYTPNLHKKAKRYRSRGKMQIVQETIIPLKQKEVVTSHTNSTINNSDITEIKSTLGCISNKMSSVVSRLDLLVTKVVDSNNTLNANFTKFFKEQQSVQVNYDNPKLDSLLDKVVTTQDKFNTYIEDFHRTTIAQGNQVIPEPLKEEKLDKLLDSVEKLLKDGLKIDGFVNNHNTNGGGYSKIKTENKIQMDDIPMYVPKIETDISQKNIITKEIESEGTDNILEKLKNLK